MEAVNKSIKMRRYGLLILFFVFACSVEAAPNAQILEYGYFEFVGEAKRLEHPATASGYVSQGKAELVEKTHRIPLKKGRLFGFRFRIDGIDKNVGRIPLELVVVHPEMKKPDGKLSSGYRYFIDLKLKDGAVEDKVGYRMTEDFELVEGEWQFEFRLMNKTLMKQNFTTFKEES